MTEVLAIEIARLRMLEIGQQKYVIRFRHLVLTANEVRVMKAENELLILTAPIESAVKIKSKMGTYDSGNPSLRELQYVHSGHVTIQNTSGVAIHVRLLQVIQS